MTVSESKRKANKKWDEANKARKLYINKRSTARSFIKKLATQEDIDELKALIEAREEDLKK